MADGLTANETEQIRDLRSRLNRMVADGLLTRQRYREVPPRVDYELTELGRGVAERLLGLIQFLEGRMDDVLDARRSYDETRGGL